MFAIISPRFGVVSSMLLNHITSGMLEVRLRLAMWMVMLVRPRLGNQPWTLSSRIQLCMKDRHPLCQRVKGLLTAKHVCHYCGCFLKTSFYYRWNFFTRYRRIPNIWWSKTRVHSKSLWLSYKWYFSLCFSGGCLFI